MHILVVEDERALCDTLIYRMLLNLTENAIRYNRPDSRVQISVSEKNDDVLIRVKDNGFGIPEQYRESIFQPFFRVDKSRSREHGGVGLGLALVWEIASLHGGTLSLPTFADCGQPQGLSVICKSRYFAQIKLYIQRCRAGVIPLLGEMSAKQTKGCLNSGEFAPAVELLLIYDNLR